MGAPVRVAAKPITSTNYLVGIGTSGQVWLTAYWISAGRLDATADEADWPRQQTWLVKTMKGLGAAVAPAVLELLAGGVVDDAQG
jgi:hypothetical protein